MADPSGDWPELLTPAEVGRMFRVDPRTVTRWAAEGRLRSIRTLGGQRRFFAAELAELLAGGGGRPTAPRADTAEEL